MPPSGANLQHDRARGNAAYCGWSATFALTHEFLGYTLGVSRPGVTVAARTLRHAGLIDYHRPGVTVLDRPDLEAAACACYATIHDGFTRLLG